MESLVLCPEELCLGPAPLAPPALLGLSPPPADLTLLTNEHLDKGTRFLPWKGTVRSDKLAVFDKLPEFDVRNRFGLYDEISEVSVGRKVRQCNWIRFLRYSLVYSDVVNVVGAKGPTGEPIFELIKDVEPKTELVCFFVPERPEEAFLLPAIQYLRHTLFKRLIDNVLEESPLDLSTSLVSKVFPISPSNSYSSEGGRKSVSSDCSASITNESVSDRSSLLTKTLAAFPTLATPPTHNFLSVEALASKSPSINNNNNNDKVESEAKPVTKTTNAQPTRAPVVRRREKNMLPCSYCGKAFDRPSLLKRHIRIHTGERPHVCDICSKGFSTSSSLNTHRRIHSGEKPHQCGVCGKRFTASSNLYYHKMTHVKEKPHKCTMCSKSFPTPGDLKSHTYVHTGTWPFKCHICHRGFSKQTNLKNHLLLHSGDKPFSCDICHKKFALSCNLRAHLKTHEAEYQSSSASLALYQRALAVLGNAAGSNAGSSVASPSADTAVEDSRSSAASNMSEDDQEAESRQSASPTTVIMPTSPPRSRPETPERRESQDASSPSSANLAFAKQLTVVV